MPESNVGLAAGYSEIYREIIQTQQAKAGALSLKEDLLVNPLVFHSA
jgi:hypothetical protein